MSSIVLTTHSMEEAEIIIMVNGNIKEISKKNN